MEIILFFVGCKFCYVAWLDGAKGAAVAFAAMLLVFITFILRIDYCIIQHVDVFTGRPW